MDIISINWKLMCAFNFTLFWFAWTTLMAYSRSKLKRNGDKAALCFKCMCVFIYMIKISWTCCWNHYSLWMYMFNFFFFWTMKQRAKCVIIIMLCIYFLTFFFKLPIIPFWHLHFVHNISLFISLFHLCSWKLSRKRSFLQVLLTFDILHSEFENNDHVTCMKVYYCVSCVSCLNEVLFPIMQWYEREFCICYFSCLFHS